MDGLCTENVGEMVKCRCLTYVFAFVQLSY